MSEHQEEINHVLLYFCAAVVILFFRRLCSEPVGSDGNCEPLFWWWVQTVVLTLFWPVLAPLAGAYHIGKSLRNKLIEG